MIQITIQIKASTIRQALSSLFDILFKIMAGQKHGYDANNTGNYFYKLDHGKERKGAK